MKVDMLFQPLSYFNNNFFFCIKYINTNINIYNSCCVALVLIFTQYIFIYTFNVDNFIYFQEFFNDINYYIEQLCVNYNILAFSEIFLRGNFYDIANMPTYESLNTNFDDIMYSLCAMINFAFLTQEERD